MRANRARASGTRLKKRRPSVRRPSLVRPRRARALGEAGRQVSRRLQRLLAQDRPAILPGTQDPLKAASAAHLHDVSDEAPGITRVAAGSAFRYRRPDGQPVRCDKELPGGVCDVPGT
jgi:hypothetical protein